MIITDFATHIVDLLKSFGPCESSRMFGGYGIFHPGLMLGLIADGLVERSYSHPHWYHSHGHGTHFLRALSISFDSAIASSSVASGSSGGSGGGGGGSGGGGW